MEDKKEVRRAIGYILRQGRERTGVSPTEAGELFSKETGLSLNQGTEIIRSYEAGYPYGTRSLKISEMNRKVHLARLAVYIEERGFQSEELIDLIREFDSDFQYPADRTVLRKLRRG